MSSAVNSAVNCVRHCARPDIPIVPSWHHEGSQGYCKAPKRTHERYKKRHHQHYKEQQNQKSFRMCQVWMLLWLRRCPKTSFGGFRATWCCPPHHDQSVILLPECHILRAQHFDRLRHRAQLGHQLPVHDFLSMDFPPKSHWICKYQLLFWWTC